MYYDDFEREFIKLVEEDLNWKTLSKTDQEHILFTTTRAWMAFGRALIKTKTKLTKEEK